MTDETPTPAKTGRPRKAPGERLADGLRVRMTAAERASIEARAAAAGLSPSEFARRAIAGAKIMAPANDRAAIPPMLIAELGRIGNNLNQIAHAAHLGRDLPGMAEVALAEVRALVAAITERLDR
ncbi:MobC family plasmid mobilization relaxosome protein [Paracoccus fontiphilus]|nr:MobC family plasmid mobilization relaxosome protein [Paracoccus fontiphilus]